MKRPRFGLVESFILIFTLFAGIELFIDFNAKISAARKNAERLFVQTSKNVKVEFGYINNAVTMVLKSARSYRDANMLDFTNPWSANALFITYMRQYPFITSINSGDAAGSGYLILRTGEEWKNRIKKANEKGLVTWLILDEKGKVISTERHKDDYDPRKRPWYQNAVSQKEIVWSDPYIFRTTRDVGITASMRLNSGTGSREVVGIDIMLKDMSHLLAGLAADVNGMAAHLIAQDGTVIACSEAEQFLSLLKKDDSSLPGIGEGRYPRVEAALQSRKGDKAFWSFTFKNKRFLAIMETVSFSPDRKFNLALTVPEDVMGGNFIHDALWKLVIFLILLTAASAWYIVRYLIPLRRIATAIKDFGAGKFRSLTVDAARKDEIGALASEFTQMANALTEKEESLKESQAKFREISCQFHALLDAIPDNLTLQSPDLRVLWANKGAAAGLGKEVSDMDIWTGAYCYALWHNRTEPCDPCPVLKSFRTGVPAAETVTTPDGRLWDLRAVPIKDAEGKVISVIEVGRDITEHRKLEAQLQQSQKIEAVGTLAGGIAHDFNNILTAIIGYGHILKMKLEQKSPLMGYTDQILASAERAAHLTQSLLAFSRKQVINPKPVNLNEITASVEKILLRIIGEDIELKTILSGIRDLRVMADAGQLEQVLMNLAANARDAMPEGGTLTIETSTAELDINFLKIHEYGKPGMYAMITVTDTGHGMDENTRQRIFEPFFTTKEVGKGTGLGLSMVYGIIKQHSGYINCYSEQGKGTTFRIYLPLIKEEAKEAKAAAEGYTALTGGTETIILAEDEEEVRKLMKLALEDAGYKVIEAVDGKEAIEKFRENKDSIDLLLLDVIMPKINGKGVYEEAKKIKPDVKALFSSGYPADFIHKKGILEEGLNFISKPASPHELLKRIREAIDK
mgnify:CR=1 FL=1